MRGPYFLLRLSLLVLGLTLPLGPSLLRGQQEEENETSKAKVTVKKETTQTGQTAPPPKEKKAEKESEEKPRDELETWVEKLPYRILPPLGNWAVEPSGPWFY